MRRRTGQRQTWAAITLAATYALGACGSDATSPPDAADASPDSALPTAAPTDRYDIGSPALIDLYVDPVHDDDAHDGSTPAQAKRTLTQAWRSLPDSLTTGVRLRLLPGSYFGVYLESKHGSPRAPIVITSDQGRATVTIGEAGGIGGLTLFDASYVYLIDVTVAAPADPFHLDHCDHILLRQSEVRGTRGGGQTEGVKVNQSQYIYLEDSDLHGAGDNAVDFVAVQYAHILGCRIHDADDWCAYTKGGSAYVRVADNEIYDCGTGGFTAGQGTGFQFMVAPWIHYEAYGIEAVNNVVHDTWGACLGVMGGYDILYAYNTCYRVGTRSHVLEVGLGGRSCDGHDAAACRPNLDAGGWGVLAEGGDFIPARHVAFIANLVYDPPGVHAAWQHLSVAGPGTAPAESHLSGPQRADDDLRLSGNLVWNQPPDVVDMALGVGGEACTPDNATCNPTQLLAANAFNTALPHLGDPAHGDFHPLRDPAWASVPRADPSSWPDWDWSDLPPLADGTRAPAGGPHHGAARDRAGVLRGPDAPPGAYTFAPE